MEEAKAHFVPKKGRWAGDLKWEISCVRDGCALFVISMSHTSSLETILYSSLLRYIHTLCLISLCVGALVIREPWRSHPVCLCYILFCCIIFKRDSLLLLCTIFPSISIQCVYTYHILWLLLTVPLVDRVTDRVYMFLSALAFRAQWQRAPVCLYKIFVDAKKKKKNGKTKQKKRRKKFYFFYKEEIYGLINIFKIKFFCFVSMVRI